MPIVSEPLGRVLGNRYRLVAALGSGASAHVFLAEDMVLQRRVAVKVLQPALARDEVFLRRFRAEARAVAALNHPHVLRVFDWGEGDDGPYLVIEYLEGGSLFDMLARGRRLSPWQAAGVGAQAADGLAYAHARGIVHRDVKPANILFDEEGRVRVADFGVARALSSASTTDPGKMLGTARYASPEQAQGLPLDGRSDVYSLGLVLYEATTGSVPFDRETPHATLQARIGERVPHDPALGPLAPLLAMACAPEHEDRPDAARLAERLEALAEDLAPGGPLPLVRRGRIDDAGPGPRRLADLTVVLSSDDLPLAGASAVAVGPGRGAGAGTGRTGGAPAGGVVDTGEPTATIRLDRPGRPDRRGRPGDGASPGGDALARRRRRPPRRWPWVVAVVVVVAAILAAVGVYLEKSKLLTASHRVPALQGETVASASRALHKDHFVVKVAAAVTSTKVPAGEVISQSPARGVSLKEGSTVRIVPSGGLPTVHVPSLSGKGFDSNCAIATQLLQERHLEAKCPALLRYSRTVPADEVINWSYHGKLDPKTVPYGSTILIAVSKGLPPVGLPSLVGQTYTHAAQTLSGYGLAVKEAHVYSTTVAVGQVISTTPAAGVAVFVGSTVTVTVSLGPQYVAVPTVIGDTGTEAASAIRGAGLTVGAVYGPGTGVVFTTDPLAGQSEKLGAPIALYTEVPPGTGNGPGAGAGAGAGTTGSATTGTGTGGSTGASGPTGTGTGGTTGTGSGTGASGAGTTGPGTGGGAGSGG
jgi:eukaryotic-like serine/threonine-protein kinase